MQIDLFNGLAYEEGTFNAQRGTDQQSGKTKLKEDLKILITQEKGKFYPDPEFGSRIMTYLFEPMTEAVGYKIKEEIRELVEKYYPQITLTSVDVELLQDTNTIDINLSYYYGDSEVDSDTLEINLFNTIS